jgi:hypothetical protein
MHENSPVPPFRAIAAGCALLVLCIAYVPMRGERGGPAVYGDAQLYVDLVRGGVDVEAPFRYRVVVPLLARALPLAPASALVVISWLSLAASYALLLVVARRLSIGAGAASLGLLLASLTGTHLYNYQNPFITDAAGLLITTVCLYALVSRRFGLFACASALGIGVREVSLFAAPAWIATRQWWRAGASLACTLAVYVALRALVGPSRLTLDEGPFAIFPARPLPILIWDAACAWHALWPMAPIGLLSVRAERTSLAVLALSLLAGAVFTSLLATDTTRMFQPLFPLAALGAGRFLELSWRASRRLTALVCVACVASSWVWQPVRFLTLAPEAPIYRPAQATALVLLLLIGSLAAHRVWRSRVRTGAASPVLEAAG